MGGGEARRQMVRAEDLSFRKLGAKPERNGPCLRVVETVLGDARRSEA